MKFILILVFIFISFLVIMNIIAKKYDDPYYIDIFYGLPGSGKSTDIVKYSILVNTEKTPYDRVYCNMNNVAGTYYFNLKELIEINKNKNDDNYFIPFKENSVVCIDEAGYYINNRDFKNFSKFMQYLCRYVRHHKIYLRFYSQAIDTDLVIRNLARRYYILKKYFNCITLIKPIFKDMGIGMDNNGNGKLVESFQYASIFQFKFNWIPRYIGLFDSHEVKTKTINDNTVLCPYNENLKYATNLRLYIQHLLYKAYKKIHFFLFNHNSFKISLNSYLNLVRF